MSELDNLLVVQDHDTVLDQLRHRRRTLPERAALQGLEDELASLERQRGDAEAQLAAVTARQEESERETEATVKRMGEIDARMRSGTVAARDLAAMQTEIDHLKARQLELEDRTLAAMEEREPLDTLLADLDAKRESLDEQAAAARLALTEAEVAVDGEIVSVDAERSSAAASVPPVLMQEYERLRERLGGVGAAALAGGSCAGCHLSLSATELDRIKKLPPDALVHCEQCGRILVRIH